MNNIRYLQRKDIDEEAWNRCIDTADNGLIYAYTYYLDAMCSDWDALVLNDYEAVMPLPWRKKWGIKYVYPPAFTQQLGIIGNGVTNESYLEVLQRIQSKFSFGEYMFNFRNSQIGIPKANYILNLNRPYTSIHQNYKNVLIKNLKRSKNLQLYYQPFNNYHEIITSYQLQYGNRISHVSASDYRNLAIVFKELEKRNQLILRGVQDENKQTLAFAACPKDDKRIYLLLSVTKKNGKYKQANHFLLDQLIKEFTGSQLLLDFEGSDLPGIAHFYRNYGAEEQPYFFYRWNHLPWPINVLKGKSTTEPFRIKDKSKKSSY
jgi:hypothetical protein